MFHVVKTLPRSKAFGEIFRKYLADQPCSSQRLSEEDVEEVKIPVPWGHIAGKWWGNRDEVPLIGLHGWQDNAGTYDRLAPLLNITSFLAIDLPGHGFSSHLPKGKICTFLDYVLALRRVVDHFKWKNYSLMGHSYGSAIGFSYSSIFNDEVGCFISIECARALLLAYRTDMAKFLAQGIDKILELEDLTADFTPLYSFSEVVRMLVLGSLGSVSTPESAFVLMKRGVNKHDAKEVSAETRKNVGSHLNLFVDHELSSSKESNSEGIMGKSKELEEMLRALDEKLKLLKPEGEDDCAYSFTRDPRVKFIQFGVLSEKLIYEASRHINCPMLSLRGREGYLKFASKKVYDKSNDIIKKKSVHFEDIEVEGNHHCHLNSPENVARVVNDFLRHWKHWGPKDKRIFLLLHGWLDNAGSFDPLVPFLPKNYGYLAIDLPGHGYSSHFPKGTFYSPYDSVGFIRKIQKHFKWTNVSLIGHSLGSVISYLFAAIYPDDVDIYIGIDSFKPISTEESVICNNARGQIEKLLYYDSFDLEMAKKYTEQQYIDMLKEALKLPVENCKIMMKRGALEINGKFMPRRDPKLKPTPAFWFTKCDNEYFARRIKCNTLIIKSNDTTTYEPQEIFYDTLDLVKKAAKYMEFHTTSGPHHLHMERPEVVSSFIIKFLENVKSSS